MLCSLYTKTHTHTHTRTIREVRCAKFSSSLLVFMNFSTHFTSSFFFVSFVRWFLKFKMKMRKKLILLLNWFSDDFFFCAFSVFAMRWMWWWCYSLDWFHLFLIFLEYIFIHSYSAYLFSASPSVHLPAVERIWNAIFVYNRSERRWRMTRREILEWVCLRFGCK